MNWREVDEDGGIGLRGNPESEALWSGPRSQKLDSQSERDTKTGRCRVLGVRLRKLGWTMGYEGAKKLGGTGMFRRRPT